MKPTATLSILALALPLSGCFWFTTKSEGQSLRRDVTSLQGRIDTKEQSLDTQVNQLKKVLDEATRLLKRNSADLGADVDALRGDIRTANGLVTAMNNTVNELKVNFEKYRKDNDSRLDSLEQRVAQLESGKPSANSSPDDLWKLGSQAFEAGRYNDAIDIFKRLVQTYPTNDRADDAQYFRAQSYAHMKDYDRAIGAYQQLVEKYPTSDLADDGLYFAAMAAEELKNCTEARTYLSLIKTKYPRSNVKKQAAALDTKIRKVLRNKSKCSS